MTVLCTAVAGLVFTFSGFFQIVRMHETKSARDVSIWFITLMTVGVAALWLAVMISNTNLWIQYERSVNLAMTIFVQAAVMYYKREDKRNAT
jgi:uncharacterized protein with PQ loop repeat